MSPEIPLLLLAGGQGVVLSFGLMASSLRGSRGGVFLGLVLFVLSLVLLTAWGMKTGTLHDAPPFWLLESFLIIPPALWCFVQTMTVPGFRFGSRQYLLFVPAGIEVATESTVYLINRIAGTHIRLLDHPFWLFLTEIVPVIGMGYVMILFGRKLWVSGRGWPVGLTGLFALLSGLTILWIGEVLFQLPIFSYTEGVLIGGLLALCFVAFFRTSFFQAPVFTPEKKEEPFSPEEEKDWQLLVELFQEKEAHIVSRITVDSVAAELGLSARYVSSLINRFHGANFSHFVNSYRVRTVIQRMNDPKEQHKTLLAIALECGFNSKSSFNESFKQHTGKTPSGFLRKAQTGPES